MKGSILLCGQPEDPPLAAVQQELAAMGCEAILLDRRLAAEANIEVVTGVEVAGCLRVGGEELDLAQISSVYLRSLQDASEPKTAPSYMRLQNMQDVLYSWADVTSALVLNRPTPMAANDSKPYQLAWLEALGFRVPETLLTTDPAAAAAFWELHGSVIYKSLSGTRSIVSCLGPDHRHRLQNVSGCPTQFQQRVPGLDYRVHVVGNRLFPVMIHSEGVDYRYAPVPFESTPCSLPAEVSALCLHAAQVMKLTLAGLDLRRTPGGEWFCFEVNPSPAFSSFEGAERTVAKAVAHLLADP